MQRRKRRDAIDRTYLDRVKLDLWYINNWSLWLDIQILVKTFFEVLRKRNAY